MNMTVRISVEEIKNEVEGFNSDWYYLIDDIGTSLYKELDSREVVFQLDSLDDFDTVKQDIEILVTEIREVIDSENEDFESDCPSGVDNFIDHQEWIRSRQ